MRNGSLGSCRGFGLGFDRIQEFVTSRVAEKLSGIPPENIVAPKPEVAGPSLEALRYAGHDETLRELFANLLATSMDSSTATNAHPGFVEILKNLSPDEALIMQFFTRNGQRPMVIVDVRAHSKEKPNEYEIGRDIRFCQNSRPGSNAYGLHPGR
jgi:hypothetical protein